MRAYRQLILMIVLACATFAVASKSDRVMDFHAIHRQTKEPLANVALMVRVSADNYKIQRSWDLTTDSQGFCRIELPEYKIETLPTRAGW